jgi:hypothetical protein
MSACAQTVTQFESLSLNRLYLQTDSSCLMFMIVVTSRSLLYITSVIDTALLT